MNAYDDDQQSDPIQEARRKFLKIAIAALTFTSGVVLGLPFIRTILPFRAGEESGLE